MSRREPTEVGRGDQVASPASLQPKDLEDQVQRSGDPWSGSRGPNRRARPGPRSNRGRWLGQGRSLLAGIGLVRRFRRDGGDPLRGRDAPTVTAVELLVGRPRLGRFRLRAAGRGQRFRRFGGLVVATTGVPDGRSDRARRGLRQRLKDQLQRQDQREERGVGGSTNHGQRRRAYLRSYGMVGGP